MKRFFVFLWSVFSIMVFSQKKWTLQEMVNHAMEKNLQVVQNQFNKNIQEKNLEIAKRNYLPSVDGNFSANSSFGQGRDIFGNVQRNDNFSNNASVGANMLLYNNGRLQKNIDKTQLDLDAANFDAEAVKNNISLQIAQLYLQVLLNKEVYKINENSLQNAEKLLQRAKITTSVGTTPMTIQAEAQANVAREKQKVQSSKIDINRALFDLAMLLQIPDYQNFEVAEVPLPDFLKEPLQSVDGFVEKAYQNQPSIKAAEARIKAAEKNTELTKTQFFPTVTASAGLGTSYFNLLNRGTDINFPKQYRDNFGQQLGISANIPIFNKGITRLQVEQSKINESIAANSLEIEKNTLRQNIQKAYFDANSNYQNYMAAVEAEQSTKLALDFAEKSYAAGRTTIYDLNIARNNYVLAQSSVSQAKFNYIFSMKLLDFYAGVPLSL